MLSMDRFDKLVFESDTIAAVGVGVVLKNLSSAIAQRLSLPHGECPLVGIGGHVQTGGLGHLLHSFGLCLDRCVSFDMVTADGQLRRYSRGNPVYAAVLGGGPGSFGVLTTLRFDCIPNDRYVAGGVRAESYGFRIGWWYSDAAFRAALAQWCEWTARVAAGTLPDGVDFALSAVSGFGLGEVTSGNLPRPPVVLLEGIDIGSDPARTDYFRPFINGVKAASPVYFPLYDGKQSLSSMTDSIVRTQGLGTTRSGREFSYPYKKRTVVFLVPMSPQFANDFAALVSETMGLGLKVVVQLLAGGGQYRNPPSGSTQTHAQWRNLVYALVFDVFYSPGGWFSDSDEDEAKKQQAKMKALLDKHQIHDRRMFWGSYEENDDPSELVLSNVVAQYYNSASEFELLKNIKRQVDPTDLFQTSFTVPPN
jgi:FAD/FMN-containing dehydrogenase